MPEFKNFKESDIDGLKPMKLKRDDKVTITLTLNSGTDLLKLKEIADEIIEKIRLKLQVESMQVNKVYKFINRPKEEKVILSVNIKRTPLRTTGFLY
jgi:small-conductance mechanosensitive channel